MGFALPTAVAGLGWGDWRGGFFYAAAARLLFVHHSTFCVNSLAHWLGDTPFDSKHTPRDHVFTALVTIGEGYHNCASPSSSIDADLQSTTSFRRTSATPSSGTSTTRRCAERARSFAG